MAANSAIVVIRRLPSIIVMEKFRSPETIGTAGLAGGSSTSMIAPLCGERNPVSELFGEVAGPCTGRDDGEVTKVTTLIGLDSAHPFGSALEPSYGRVHQLAAAR